MKKYVSCMIPLLAIFLMIMIGILLNSSYINYIDTYFFRFVHQGRNHFLDCFFTFFSYTGEPITILAILLFLWMLPTRKQVALPLTIPVLFSTILNFIIKNLVRRSRPDISFFFQNPLNYPYPSSYSFPSGHSQTSMVFFVLFFTLIAYQICKKKNFIIFISFFTTLIYLWMGFGRSYMGVHYPTDVLAGWSLGLIILLFSFGFLQKYPTYRFVYFHVTNDKGTPDVLFKEITYHVDEGLIDNYFIQNGEKKQCYIIGLEEGSEKKCGRLIAYVHRKDDIEDRYVISTSKTPYSKEEIAALIAYKEQYFDSKIFML